MDLSRILLKRNQKANMGPYIPHPCGADFFSMAHLSSPGAAFSSFAKVNGNMPFRSFSYPNKFSDFYLPPEKFINRGFTQGVQNFKRSLNTEGAMSLTCIVGGFMEGKQGVWNSGKKEGCFDSSLETMLNHIVSKSMEITRTMSCPDPFNLPDFVPLKPPCNKEGSQPDKSVSQSSSPKTKMSYADVAKLNLSNLNISDSNSCRPAANTNNSSSQKTNGLCLKRKVCKVISPPQPYKVVNKNYTRNNRNGTNTFIKADKDCGKPKFCPLSKNSNSRKPQNKRAHFSLKRELGTKRNNQKVDFDGSMWSRENTEALPEVYEDRVAYSPVGPPILIRVRSFSSDSDCSSEVSECLKNPRVRSISECSINSVDSEDSFIVFDDASDDKMDESLEEESSSDENDEYSLLFNGHGVNCKADYVTCCISKLSALPSKREVVSKCQKPTSGQTNSCFSPCGTLKKVRFACGNAFAKVKKLCVWDYAHRAARIGPWEQAARDRERFAKRISSLAPVINSVLNETHRSKIYNMRFAPR